ncbi:hypothetical protein Tco_0528417 [Tanacetum coccineum]
MNDGRLCANMIDHFTPPAFFKTVRGMEHEQLFTEFNVSAARNLSLSSEESFHLHLLNVVAGRRWLLTHGMKLLVVKYLNSAEYMEALGHAFGRAIEKGMQEGLAAGIEHGQAGRCLTDLKAYIPSAENDFNSAICDLRDLNFPLLQELFNKNDASTLGFIYGIFSPFGRHRG